MHMKAWIQARVLARLKPSPKLIGALAMVCFLTMPTLAQQATAVSPQPKPTASQSADALPAPHWILPVQGKITNPFGNSYRYYQIYRGGHTGVDISAKRGAPVLAVADGKVVRVFQAPNQRYGQYVIVQHGPKLYSLYGHLQQIHVRNGQQVRQGQPLATVGITGAAGYPHLHIEALDRLPRRDGAWGYLYICHAVREQEFSFVNQPAFVISSIRRQNAKGCTMRPLNETLTYFNPELLWSAKPLQHQVRQPENEELKYRRTAQQVPANQANAQPKPSQSASQSPGQPVLNPRVAAPDKTPAPTLSAP